MIRLFLGAASKLFLSYLFWVFVLSLRWEGQTIFDYSHEVLIENKVVEAVEDQVADFWQNISTIIQDSYANYQLKEKEEVYY